MEISLSGLSHGHGRHGQELSHSYFLHINAHLYMGRYLIVVVTCVLVSKSQSEIIGLRTRVDQICHWERMRKLFTDPLGVEDKIVMEEPRVGVKNLHLLLTSLDNMRMTVSNVANIVDTVEILKICSFQNSTLLYFKTYSFIILIK